MNYLTFLSNISCGTCYSYNILFFDRFYLQVSHMGVYLNFQKVSIFHAQWAQPLLERLVYLVINHQY